MFKQFINTYVTINTASAVDRFFNSNYYGKLLQDHDSYVVLALNGEHEVSISKRYIISIQRAEPPLSEEEAKANDKRSAENFAKAFNPRRH